MSYYVHVYASWDARDTISRIRRWSNYFINYVSIGLKIRDIKDIKLFSRLYIFLYCEDSFKRPSKEDKKKKRIRRNQSHNINHDKLIGNQVLQLCNQFTFFYLKFLFIYLNCTNFFFYNVSNQYCRYVSIEFRSIVHFLITCLKMCRFQKPVFRA